MKTLVEVNQPDDESNQHGSNLMKVRLFFIDKNSFGKSGNKMFSLH